MTTYQRLIFGKSHITLDNTSNLKHGSKFFFRQYGDFQLLSFRQLAACLLARQQELDRRASDLEAVEQTLQERWGQLQEASNDDMEHLARMYGTMKPDQAASIFNQMDSDFAAGFMRLMRSEQAGMILAGMETRKAYAVSLKLAALNEDVRNASPDN